MSTGLKHILAISAIMLSLLVASTVLVVMGNVRVAMIVSTFGTYMTLIAFTVYVILFDPMKKWVNKSYTQRVYRLFTLKD